MLPDDAYASVFGLLTCVVQRYACLEGSILRWSRGHWVYSDVPVDLRQGYGMDHVLLRPCHEIGINPYPHFPPLVINGVLG